MRILMNLGRFAMLVTVLGVATLITVVTRGVYYWWRVLPSEDMVLTPQDADDIFAELRWPGGAVDHAMLYSDTLSPLLLEGLALPTSECELAHPDQMWSSSGQLLMYLRSKGQPVAFCNGDVKSCWPLESVLSGIAIRMKYSSRIQTELYLMLVSFPPVGIACEEIIGHSCRDVSPEEAAVVSRWVRGPISLMDGRSNLSTIQKKAAAIAAACHKPYVPATSMKLVPPYKKRRLPQVSFVYAQQQTLNKSKTQGTAAGRLGREQVR